jgi:hypothetical protein
LSESPADLPDRLDWAELEGTTLERCGEPRARRRARALSLPVVYVVWLCVVAALYPVCRRYAALKARSRAWWLSYL